MKYTKLSPVIFTLFPSMILASCSNESTIPTSLTDGTPSSNLPQGTSSIPMENPTPLSSSRAVTNTQALPKTVTYRTDHGKHIVYASFDIVKQSDGTIASVIAIMNRGDHESAEYIARFNNAAKTKVIGKKIGDIKLTSIGGASDTTKAFLEVLSSP